ncbi:MAG: hypothetical protein AABN95_20815 [Acidobacteriota bacterium]
MRNAYRRLSAVNSTHICLSLAHIIVAVHFLIPAWTISDTTPLNQLGQRALPGLQRGEPLVMYALHPRRPGLRYTLGDNQQIIETFSPDILQSVLNDAGVGYILSAKDQSLPPLSGTLQQEAVAGKWELWHYQRNNR